MERAPALGSLLPGLEREVLELAVDHHRADVRAVEVDLVDGELAGEESEESRAQGDPVAVDQGDAAVGRFDANVVELDRERPDPERGRVRRDHALLLQDALRLAGGPVPGPRRPDDERGDEGDEADEGQHCAEDARDHPPPVAPPAPAAPARSGASLRGRRRERAVSVGRHRRGWEGRARASGSRRSCPPTLASGRQGGPVEGAAL